MARANDLGTLYGPANCVALVGFGIISDRLQVRKPVMFAGAIIVNIAVIFIMTAHDPGYWAPGHPA